MKVLVEKVRMDDDDPDFSWIGEYTDSPGQEDWDAGKVVDRRPDDRFGRYARTGEYRYFVAANSVEETGSPESVQADYERAEAYNRGEWSFVGVKVRVTLTDERGFSKVIESGGLWGIESDSGDAYFNSVAEDEWGEVKDEIQAECFYVDQAKEAFDAAEWTDKENA